MPTCQVGIAESQDTLERVIEFFRDKNYTGDVLPKIHISGCPSSCATHQVAYMGFAGKKKRVGDKTEEAYEIYIGGDVGKDKTTLGNKYGEVLSKDLPLFLYDLAIDIANNNLTFCEYVKNKRS